MFLNIQLDTTSTPKRILESVPLTRGKYALFSFFISMPELPPRRPSWSGALGFPRACSGLSHFSSLFCCAPWYTPGRLLGLCLLRYSLRCRGWELPFHCTQMSGCCGHSSPRPIPLQLYVSLRPTTLPAPREERPLYRCHFCLQSFHGFPSHVK